MSREYPDCICSAFATTAYGFSALVDCICAYDFICDIM